MLHIRKLVPLVVALAATALTAPSAVGSPIEVTNEGAGIHCPAVNLQAHSVGVGCLIHVNSEGSVILRQHIFGIESTADACNMEFLARINESGVAYVYSQQLTGKICINEPCNEELVEEKKDPWPLTGREDLYFNAATGSLIAREVMRLTYCINDIGTHDEVTCTVDIPVVPTPNHQLEFGITGTTGQSEMPGIGTAGFRCEVIGHWTTETGFDDLEITHL